MTKDPRTRLLFLREHLHAHNRLYAMDRPTITDEEYDRLFAELTALESANPELSDPNSPTARVGAPPCAGFAKIKHETKMLSLDNAFSTADVLKFFGEGVSVLVEPKIDGLSLEASYVDGRLARAVTRGDGSVGEDVTANARTIRALPLSLPQPVNLRVRGEVYMRFSVFDKLNEALAEAGEEPFANPRNAASGSMKLKDPREVAKRQLSFVAYGVANEFKEAMTQTDLVEYLALLGFVTARDLPTRTLPSSRPVGDRIGGKITLHEASLDKTIADLGRINGKLDLPTDGLVFKLLDRAKQRELGDGTRSPRWALAYKFPPERKLTKLNAITLSVGKTGKITPIAELEPISLGGTVVRRASLMNADEVGRLGVSVGDTVLIEKSAEIIPRVVGAYEKVYIHKNGKQGTLREFGLLSQ